jgi:hypothetical protein
MAIRESPLLDARYSMWTITIQILSFPPRPCGRNPERYKKRTLRIIKLKPNCHPLEGGDPGFSFEEFHWIPASAGMTQYLEMENFKIINNSKSRDVT